MQYYADLHCDTLMIAFQAGQTDFFDLPEAMLDIRRMRMGGCMAQFFAIFLSPGPRLDLLSLSDEAYIAALADIFYRTMAKHRALVAPACCEEEVRGNFMAGKISCILSMEDGRSVQGRLDNLERYYKLGIRALSLTWNEENCFGFPNSHHSAVMRRGLKPFGKQAVSYMNELGMIIDVSHLSDGGFWDVAERTKKPFVATHSNCRALNPHPRSLTDEMIRALADRGGVIGLNFGPEFLSMDTSSKTARMNDLVAQVQHMVRVGGIACVALGSDFDGIEGTLDIAGPQDMPALFEGLYQAGFSPEEVYQMAWGNALRVLKDTL